MTTRLELMKVWIMFWLDNTNIQYLERLRLRVRESLISVDYIHIKWQVLHHLLFVFLSGSAIKCWECNSKHDPRCGDPFSNFSIALVDCDQKSADITHLLDEHEKLKYTVDEGGEPKATICRKTYQFGKFLIFPFEMNM